MSRRSYWPFFVSAAAAAAAGAAAFSRAGAGGAPGGAAGPAPRGAWVEPRAEVAHEADLAARAAEAAAGWLERHQYSEGAWSARSYTQMCEGKVCLGRGADEHDVGVTALAAWALMESGRGDPAARRALAWLAARQDGEGAFGPRAGKFMYGQALATLAFARGYPLLGEGIYKHHAARGVRFLEGARNPGLAWRYGVRDGDNDASVTGWVAAALLAAVAPEVGVDVDPAALEGALRFLDRATDGRHFGTSYTARGAGPAHPGAGGRYEPNEGLTAGALWVRLKRGLDRGSFAARAAALRLAASLPVWTEDAASVDFAAWFAGTRALAEYGDAELWRVWSGRVERLLAGRQRRYYEGCLAGSWDPVDKWGAEGGRVYATAMNLLTLGVVRSAR